MSAHMFGTIWEVFNVEIESDWDVSSFIKFLCPWKRNRDLRRSCAALLLVLESAVHNFQIYWRLSNLSYMALFCDQSVKFREKPAGHLHLWGQILKTWHLTHFQQDAIHWSSMTIRQKKTHEACISLTGTYFRVNYLFQIMLVVASLNSRGVGCYLLPIAVTTKIYLRQRTWVLVCICLHRISSTRQIRFAPN